MNRRPLQCHCKVGLHFGDFRVSLRCSQKVVFTLFLEFIRGKYIRKDLGFLFRGIYLDWIMGPYRRMRWWVSKARITKRAVDAVRAPFEGEARLRDTDLKGFGASRLSDGDAKSTRSNVVSAVSSTFTQSASTICTEEVLQGGDGSASTSSRWPGPERQKEAAKAGAHSCRSDRPATTDGPATKPAKRATTWVIDASNLNCHIRRRRATTSML